MIDAAELAQAIAEARENPENIPLPEYTFDVHTRKGPDETGFLPTGVRSAHAKGVG